MAQEVTKLSPLEEALFQKWAKQNWHATGISNHETEPYDMRGFWLDKDALSRWHPGQHFPDTYKQHAHPTFSQESTYSKGPFDGGMWLEDTYLPQPKLAVSHKK